LSRAGFYDKLILYADCSFKGDVDMKIQESSLFCELTEDELGRVIRSALGCGIVTAELKTGGMFNTTYFVKTDTAGDVILSVGPVNRHLIMPFERRCMETEAMIFALCRENGIPVSEVLALDISKTVIDRDFMIVRYIPSCMLHEAAGQYPEEKSRLYRELAKNLRKIHSIKSPRFGRMQDVRDGGGFERQSDFFKAEVEDWISVAKNTGFFTEEDYEAFRAVGVKYVGILDEVKEASVVHGDVSPMNTLIDNTGERPTLAAIIDPERGFWGDGEFDLAMIGYMLDEDFAAGYGYSAPRDEHSAIRWRIYELLRRMFDCYVWGAEYNQNDNMVSTRNWIRKQAAELLAAEITGV